MVEIEKCQLRDTRLNVQSLMTTNGQLIDTRGYHIQPTNSTYSMNSCFRLKGPCSSVRGKNMSLSAHSNFNYCRKVLSMKNILINIKTKKCTPTSVLHWECASVYLFIYFIWRTSTMPFICFSTPFLTTGFMMICYRHVLPILS